jgi:uncharacterized protein (TIGR03435 family)
MLCALAAPGPLHAQGASAADEALPRFEVASIKPADPDARQYRISTRPGQFLVENMPLLDIVASAFGVPSTRIVNAPGWLSQERFSIAARMPDGAPLSQRSLMVRALFIDRFKLRYRIDSKPGDGFELIRSNPDRLGPQLRAVSSDCAERRLAGEEMPPDCRMLAGPGSVDVSGFPVSLLADLLARQVGTVVVDRTGLVGNHEFKMRWSRQSSSPLSATQAGDVASQDPALLTALDEQLGLRLRRVPVSMDYVVIERIERPDPD